MNKTGVWIVVIIIVILIAGGIYIGTRSSSPAPITTTGQDNPSSLAPTGVNTEKIQIKSFAFSPETLTIKAGTEVEWTNLDQAPHTVVSNSGSEISSPSLSKGQTYAVLFNKPGTYEYHCSVHPSMKGTIIVK